MPLSGHSIVYQIRRDIDTLPGGDGVQLERTMDQVARQTGARVRMSVDPLVNLRDVSLVHLFNLTRATDTVRFARNARRQGVPYVISPIWHPFDDMVAFYGTMGGLPSGVVRTFGIAGYLAAKELYYETRQLRWPPIAIAARWRHEVLGTLNRAAAILPNSEAERRALERDLGQITAPTCIVPNGADPTSSHPVPAEPDDLVVCVGRIEPRKNQLAVARAFRASAAMRRYRLIFAGAQNHAHPSYLEAFERSLEPGRIEYAGELGRDEVLELFAVARIAVLASYFETTGLVGLEALACNTNVVMTERGYTRDYFGDHVEYCDPYDEVSIVGALQRATRRRSKPEPSFFQAFGWNEAGERTVAAYLNVLHQTDGPRRR